MNAFSAFNAPMIGHDSWTHHAQHRARRLRHLKSRHDGRGVQRGNPGVGCQAQLGLPVGWRPARSGGMIGWDWIGLDSLMLGLPGDPAGVVRGGG